MQILQSQERKWLDMTVAEKRCRFEGCERSTGNRTDICGMHYFRLRRGTPIDAPVLERFGGVCQVEGCPKRARGRWCAMHEARFRRHGEDIRLPTGCLAGPEHPNWVGDYMRYHTAHQRIGRPAMRCVHCGKDSPGRYQWALNWAAEPHARCNLDKGERLPYSPRTEDYIELCIPCHKTMDLAHLAAIGMPARIRRRR